MQNPGPDLSRLIRNLPDAEIRFGKEASHTE